MLYNSNEKFANMKQMRDFKSGNVYMPKFFSNAQTTLKDILLTAYGHYNALDRGLEYIF
jgi:serine protease inhibitor